MAYNPWNSDDHTNMISIEVQGSPSSQTDYTNWDDSLNDIMESIQEVLSRKEKKKKKKLKLNENGQYFS